jgi:hypothetical protein
MKQKAEAALITTGIIVVLIAVFTFCILMPKYIAFVFIIVIGGFLTYRIYEGILDCIQERDLMRGD